MPGYNIADKKKRLHQLLKMRAVLIFCGDGRANLWFMWPINIFSRISTIPKPRSNTEDGFGKAVMVCDMPESCEFPSLNSCQKGFLQGHKEVGLALHLVIGCVKSHNPRSAFSFAIRLSVERVWTWTFYCCVTVKTFAISSTTNEYCYTGKELLQKKTSQWFTFSL